MPFLNQYCVYVDDAWEKCPEEPKVFLMEQNAREYLLREVRRIKEAGATWDPNSGPDNWKGKLKNGVDVSARLMSKPFADPYTQIYADNLTLYAR